MTSPDTEQSFEMEDVQDTKSSKESSKTNWNGLIVCSGITFLCSIQMTIYMTVVFPFLRDIDNETTETYFGFLSTVSCLTLAVACFAFGYLVNKVRKSRLPLLIGTFLMIIGNVMFLSASFLPNGKLIILLARVVISAGDGVAGVLRNYFIMGSTEEDRSPALALCLVATFLGNGVGFALPGLFSIFNYPGIQIVATAIFSLLTKFLILGLLLTLFQESSVNEPNSNENPDNYQGNESPSFDKLAVLICLLTQFSQLLMIANVETIYPPLSMAMFNWTNQESLKYLSYINSSALLVSLALLMVYLMFDRNNRFNHRILSIVGGICCFVFHVVTFSWWFLPGKVVYQETNQVTTGELRGCRPAFKWCKDVSPVNPWLFSISHMVFNGLSLTFVTISMNIVYSKIIGNQNQGFMMGLLLTVGFVASTVAPIFLAFVFEMFGPRPLWAIQMLSNGIGILLWIIFYKRLVPLKSD